MYISKHIKNKQTKNRVDEFVDALGDFPRGF